MSWVVGEIDPGAALAALVGPIVAVGITLWLQGRDRSRDRKETLLRQLVATRVRPEDPAFNIALALIPIAFQHHAKVCSAHKDFLAAANRDSPDIQKRSEDLILAMMGALGFNVERARDVVREPYASAGLVNALKLQQEALEAIPRIAAAMERTAAASEETRDIVRRAQDRRNGDEPA